MDTNVTTADPQIAEALATAIDDGRQEIELSRAPVTLKREPIGETTQRVDRSMDLGMNLLDRPPRCETRAVTVKKTIETDEAELAKLDELSELVTAARADLRRCLEAQQAYLRMIEGEEAIAP